MKTPMVETPDVSSTMKLLHKSMLVAETEKVGRAVLYRVVFRGVKP